MSDERKWIASDGVTELKPGMLVLAKNGSGIWFVSLFSHLVADGEKLYRCTNGMLFEYCIPLEGNEHMAGTMLPISQKEKPFEWGEKVLVWDDEGEQKKLALFDRDGGGGPGECKDYWCEALVKGQIKTSKWRHCQRAPLDADAEQR